MYKPVGVVFLEPDALSCRPKCSFTVADGPADDTAGMQVEDHSLDTTCLRGSTQN